MEKRGWKTLAIILIIFIVLWMLYGAWLAYEEDKEYNKQFECWYEICGAYEEVTYESNLCTCYEYDFIGNLVVAKYEVMN